VSGFQLNLQALFVSTVQIVCDIGLLIGALIIPLMLYSKCESHQYHADLGLLKIAHICHSSEGLITFVLLFVRKKLLSDSTSSLCVSFPRGPNWIALSKIADLETGDLLNILYRYLQYVLDYHLGLQVIYFSCLPISMA